MPIGAKISETLKLIMCFRCRVTHGKFNPALNHGQRRWVDEFTEIARLVAVWFRHSEQAVIQTNLRGQCMFNGQPVDHALHLAPHRILAQRILINGAAKFDYVTGNIFYYFITAHHITVAQAHFTTGRQTLPASRRVLGKVVDLNPNFLAERHHATTEFWMFRMEASFA